MFALVFGLHFHVRGRHAVLPDFFGRDLPSGNVEAAQLFAQVIEREASVDQSAERHVAADSAKAIKISKFHENLPLYGYYRRLRGVSNLEQKREMLNTEGTETGAQRTQRRRRFMRRRRRCWCSGRRHGICLGDRTSWPVR